MKAERWEIGVEPAALRSESSLSTGLAAVAANVHPYNAPLCTPSSTGHYEPPYKRPGVVGEDSDTLFRDELTDIVENS